MHVFGLSGVVGDLAHVHSTQGMTGAAEINLSVLTSYAAGSKATTSGDESTSCASVGVRVAHIRVSFTSSAPSVALWMHAIVQRRSLAPPDRPTRRCTPACLIPDQG